MKSTAIHCALTAVLLLGSTGCSELFQLIQPPARPAQESSEKAKPVPTATTIACEEITSEYETEAGDLELERLVALSKRLTECGQYAYFFEHVVHWGNNDEGEKVLVELEKGGTPVEAELVKYLDSHRGPDFFKEKPDRPNDITYGLMHITKWLIDKGSTQHCAEFAAAAKDANSRARDSALEYLTEAKCKEGVSVAMASMLDENASYRVDSCRFLGSFGDESVLDKVKILADTDGYSTVNEEERGGSVVATKVYPVRDACLEAYGKIKLRG